MGKSTIFDWAEDDFAHLLRITPFDEAVTISQKYILSSDNLILEAGAGTGRVVKFFRDQGYNRVHGLELNSKAIIFAKKNDPNLDLVAGDLLQLPYKENCFDVIVSYGVVEHFPELGVTYPISMLGNVLKPGGFMIITVPAYNTMRRLSQFFADLRNWFRRSKNPIRQVLYSRGCADKGKKEMYHVFPSDGPFFEFRLTISEFEQACIDAKLEIVDSCPIYHMDGIYHSFGERIVKYENCEFKPTQIAIMLNKLLSKIPYFHNHMHLCVLQKPLR